MTMSAPRRQSLTPMPFSYGGVVRGLLFFSAGARFAVATLLAGCLWAGYFWAVTG